MSILIFIIGLSFLIFVHELGHFLAAKRFGLLVEEFGFGFPPRLFGKKIGETVYSLNLLPFGGFVKIHGERREAEHDAVPPARSFWNLPVWKRSFAIGAGVAMNFFIGWLVISSVYMIGAPQGIVITEVAPGSPAAEAGLLQGDKILGFKDTAEFIESVKSKAGAEARFSVERAGTEQAISATPRENPPPGEGALGIALTDIGFPRLSVFRSFIEGFKEALNILWAVILAVVNLIRGLFTAAPVMDGFVGPVGVFKVADEAAGFGIAYLLRLIGLISLNLVVLNILPIPALDGGRLLFLAIEKIKGAPLSPKREAIANAIGFVLLFLLMIAVTVRDVVKLF